MLIYILYSGVSYPIDVETSDIISGFKLKIMTLGISGVTDSANIELTFNGVVLHDNETASYYNIQKNSTIDMTYTPPVSPPLPPPPVPVAKPTWSTSTNVLIPVLVLTPCLAFVLVIVFSKTGY